MNQPPPPPPSDPVALEIRELRGQVADLTKRVSSAVGLLTLIAILLVLILLRVA